MVTVRHTDRARLDREIAKAIRKLGKDVVRVRYDVDTDWSGDPCVNFRVVLTDAAAGDETRRQSTGRVRDILNGIRLWEDWGLIPYINFRSKSEDGALQDPKWA
jgi:hypothetical protein